MNGAGGDCGAESRIGLDDPESAGPPLVAMDGRVPCQTAVAVAEREEEVFVREAEQGQDIGFGEGGMKERDDGGFLKNRP